ncbi:hypothetical protein [Marinobacterium stanieri]|uniref:Uncharacterized protein n=1 Tax=Marinobacterium stanieri TaxID=49186 RepID=A0A1N6XA83_9GAMM|nr:hypothetical protein [Marinobacterium stanieri]SIQ99169.1 hypothetical protein SAMN05421647_11341 [Marinobacterium stanieri]
MSQSLLDGLHSKEFVTSSIRPRMHLVKVYSPVISARMEHIAAGGKPDEMPSLLNQVESAIDSLLTDTGIELPGEAWQRATIRSAIIPLAADDVRVYGAIKLNWLSDVSDLMKSLQVQAGLSQPRPSPGVRTKMAFTSAHTLIIAKLNEFSWLHDPTQLSKQLCRTIFDDCKQLLTVHGQQQTGEDQASLMENLVRSHTKLMLSAMNAEEKRIGQLTAQDVQNHPDGLPLDGLFAAYRKNQIQLDQLVNDSLKAESGSLSYANQTSQTPSFMR